MSHRSYHHLPGRGPWAIGAALIAVGTVLGACNTSGPATVNVSGVFSDVNTLVTGAQVQLADVPVGSVTGITLDGSRAKVTMAIDESAHVPSNVTAEIDQTTLLGTWFIDLVPSRRPSDPFADGAVIRRTKVDPEVEQLVQAGAQVFGSVSTSELAQIVTAGGQGFAGQSASLRQFLNDLSSVTSGYATRTAQIRTTIDSLDQLGTSLAPKSDTDAQALTTLSHTVTALAQESGQFENLLGALNTLSLQGKTLIQTYFPDITNQLQALEAVAGQLSTHQQDLADLLEYLPLHDATMSSVARNDYLQILENIIVCGIPGGGSSTAPAFTCHGAGSVTGSGSG